MRYINKLAFTIAIAAVLLPLSAFAQSVSIVATVNDEIISSSDIQKRINLFLMNTQIPLNDQTKELIVQRVINNTIDEKIKLKEAEKEGIIISPKDLDASIKQFEKANNLDEQGGLKKLLKDANVTMDVFESQMKADMAWSRLVRRKANASGPLTQKEIEETMEMAKKDLDTPKYFVSEIFIKKDNAKDLHLLVDNLRKDSRFELYAMQFSQSPTAFNGGNLGWTNFGRLPSVIEDKLKTMKEGEVSDPIPYGDGYYIVKLEKTFDPEVDNPQIPTEDEIKQFLESKRSDELNKKLLQDLRQKAVIELRN